MNAEDGRVSEMTAVNSSVASQPAYRLGVAPSEKPPITVFQ